MEEGWASNIDVLTLECYTDSSDLHMSLVGVRGVSVINTPPEERLPVQTYVVEYDMNIITLMPSSENLHRGGQGLLRI